MSFLSNVKRPSWIAVTLMVACLAMGSTTVAHSAEAFPYVAYVTQNDTYVRSGPGGNHYPTSQLPSGYAVEVYRHDGDGWCAIRPVDGSFSLAPSHQLRVLDSRTAEVIAPTVPARVGSSIGNDRQGVQVMLERGEIVHLTEPPKPGQPWVKIAPPAGEFRWIAARRLVRTPPTEGGPASSGTWQSTASGGKSVTLAQHNEPETAPAGGNPFAHLDSLFAESAAAPTPTAASAPWQPEAAGAAPPAASAAGLAHGADAIEVIPGSPAAKQTYSTQQSTPASTSASAPGLIAGADAAPASGQARIRFEGLSPPTGPYDARVAEMQLRLSQIVVQPPATWQLASLREEAATLLAQGETPELRDQLRDLLDRVATFENVQARYRGARPGAATTAVAGSSPVVGRLPRDGEVPSLDAGMTGQTGEVLSRIRSDLGVDPSITPTPGETPPATAVAATEAKYDAVGTLKPVVSKRSQAPRYALVDDHGDVVTFITASPEVNLQAYVGKRIGVSGNRGFMPEYRRAHVTASRVMPLEERLVR